MNKILNLLLVASTLLLSQGAIVAKAGREPQPLTSDQVNTMKSVFENVEEMQDITSTVEVLQSYFQSGVKTNTDSSGKKNPIFDALSICYKYILHKNSSAERKQETSQKIQCPENMTEMRDELYELISTMRFSFIDENTRLTTVEKEILCAAERNKARKKVDENLANAPQNRKKLNQDLRELQEKYSHGQITVDEAHKKYAELIEAAMCRIVEVAQKPRNQYKYNPENEEARSKILKSFDAILEAIKNPATPTPAATKSQEERDTGKQATPSVTPSASATPTAKPSKSPTATKTPSATKIPTSSAPKVIKSYKDLSQEELNRIGNIKANKRTAEEARLLQQYRQARRAGEL